jgi:hypothetical protein
MPELILFDAQRVFARCAKRGLLPLRSRRAAWLVACGIALAGTIHASAEQACRPALTITNEQLSPMLPPALERKWTAIVVADASRCATTAGYFEVGISRLKEFGPEIEFREEFIWSAPSATIGIDFAADEAVEHAWVDSVQVCPCAPSRPAGSAIIIHKQLPGESQ